MLILQNISYTHSNKELLFDSIQLTVNRRDKIALTGNNGSGKSILLRIMADELAPGAGELHRDAVPWYIPQLAGQYDHLTIAQALQVEEKHRALRNILDGDTSSENFQHLNEDWTIEDRCAEALHHWQLQGLDLGQKMGALSGGQKTKVFLAGISIHRPELVLLDEPSNHLDRPARQLLYEFVRSASCTLVVVSHDRALLRLLPTVCELRKSGITLYGGNYDFYAAQKEIENNALSQDIGNREKALRKAREKERESLERQQKLDAGGKRKQEKAGIARIMMNTLRNKAENSTSKMRSVHAEKTDGIAEELQSLRAAVAERDQMKFGFSDSALHKGKLLFTARGVNVSYNGEPLWKKNLDLQIESGERIALQGANGSGKTTLIKLVLGEIAPTTGVVQRAMTSPVYIDQDYTLMNSSRTVYAQAMQFNTSALQEHEIKIRLNRFLFTKNDWDKPCSALSGGERLRLLLCCWTIGARAPDLIVLDEPTNNLDLRNTAILTTAINAYRGTLLVVSHDDEFLEEIGTTRVLQP